MTVRQQIPGSLGSHCSGDSGGVYYVALWGFPFLDQADGFSTHFNGSPRGCNSKRIWLVANIEHSHILSNFPQWCSLCPHRTFVTRCFLFPDWNFYLDPVDNILSCLKCFSSVLRGYCNGDANFSYL